MPIKVSRELVQPTSAWMLPRPLQSISFFLCRECSDQGVMGQIAREALSVTETISYVDSYIDLYVE